MKKSKLLIVVMLLVLVMTLTTLVACKNEEAPPSGGDNTQTPGTPSEPGTPSDPSAPSNPSNPTPVEPMPTATSIVTAIQTEDASNVQGYDFKLNINPALTIAGYTGAVNGNYEGKYRYNKTTKELNFMRKTSGALLYDGTENIFTHNDSRIKIKFNEKGDVNSVAVSEKSDEELTMVNLPFESVLTGLKEAGISEIEKNTDETMPAFKYSATMKFDADNAIIKKVLAKVESLGTSIAFKKVEFTNPQGGVKLYFNMNKDCNKIIDMTYSLDLTVDASAAKVKVAITYYQKYATDKVVSPALDGYILDKTAIADTLQKVNNSIAAVKSEKTYSLVMEAKNDFDPGWNNKGIVDSYNAVMYKNTNMLNDKGKVDPNGTIERIDFNHSYMYKAHTEAENAERYKFTTGNTKDRVVHNVSRKGDNVVKELQGVTADTQFDYLTGMVNFYKAEDIDCIKVVKNKDGSITYKVFVNKTAAYKTQQKILDIVNSNDIEGTIDADNYFNTQENEIVGANLEMVVKNDKFVSINCDTKFKYFPTAGDYTDKKITLKDSVSIVVNSKLDEAKKYEAPEKPDGTISRLADLV